ncbi:MAG: exodeoxyribonuclease V subunit beta [Rhodocyclaceae bacterium]|nr:exodeoxyribonuclease V subunit beta [Rhodocyclaceae bacterium]
MSGVENASEARRAPAQSGESEGGNAQRVLVDARDIALSGLQLVEASAGTGKTWTITALVLRFLLEEKVPIDKLLIVTFTRAAVAELSMRIRTRLAEAIQAFEQGGSEDRFLAALLARHSDREALLRLRLALASLDEASIVTIHGFCQKALREAAFAAGRHFEREIVAEGSFELHAAACDFWRREMAAASALWSAWLLDRFPQGPADLLALVRRMTIPSGNTKIALPSDCDASAQQKLYSAAFERAQRYWRQARQEIVATLAAAAGDLDRRRFDQASVLKAAALYDAWLVGQPWAPRWKEEEWKKAALLSATEIAKAAKKTGDRPLHPFHEAVDALLPLAKALAACFEQRTRVWVSDFLRTAKEQIRKRRAQTGVQSYDDLIEDLALALSGRGGDRLAAELRARYWAALVDEFQDTDLTQWAILSRLFGDQERPLILVGDPKQAIYGFRGADVFAYLTARCKATMHGLIVNRRTDQSLLTGINALFSAPRAFLLDGVSFEPAKAAEENERPVFRIDGRSPPRPLELWHLPPPAEGGKNLWNKEEAAKRLAAAVAEDIVRLLSLASKGRARIGDRALRASDIAVLVRKRRQAIWISQALAARGISSASLGGGSVWDTSEARELECLLAALADPTQEGRMRAALATRLYGWSAEAIARLDSDGALYAKCIDAFTLDRQRLESEGFLAFWRRFARREEVYRRLLAQPQGARRLTNFRQLAELISAEERRRPLDIEGMIRLLKSKREVEDEESLLRLDSDAHLVRIVTIHAAKGLQYPIVYCPFLWDAPKPESAAWPALVHEDGDTWLDFGSTDFASRAARAELEAAAEEVRLAYVAMTRAQHRLVLAWARANYAERSPLAWLLFGARHRPRETGVEEARAAFFAAWKEGYDDRAALAEFCGQHGPSIACMAPPSPSDAPAPCGDGAAGTLAARSFSAFIRRPWRVHSFSALAAGLSERFEADYDAAQAPEDSLSLREDTIHAFPRGARAGAFLHAFLERCDFADLNAVASLAESMLDEFGFDRRWIQALSELAHAVAGAALDEHGLRLADVAREARLTEVEFTFPLSSAAQSGYMKGFIDLVFTHRGRWYLLDYKSNWLGAGAEDYTPARLQAAMSAHRYELQARIYCAALYRMLALRDPAFDWERSFGGIFYVFLRGLQKGSTRGIVLLRPSVAEIAEYL